MSSHDRTVARYALVAASVLGLGLASAGCTVRPLYSTASIGTPAANSEAAKLASIGVKPVETRFGQVVRNELIFLFGHGAGEPANPAYELKLSVSSTTKAAAYVSVKGDPYDNAGVPSAGTVTVAADYVLVDTATSKTVAKGKRSAMASFDRPEQQFATVRAERDAQNRASKELANQLLLAVAADLSH